MSGRGAALAYFQQAGQFGLLPPEIVMRPCFDLTPTRRLQTGLPSLVLALTLAAAGSGCGGSDEPPVLATPATPADAPAQGDRPSAARPAAPADTAARTRNGLYASARQVEWEQLLDPLHTVLLDVDELGSADAVLRRAEQLRDWNPAAGLSYYVRARQATAGAEAVNRLLDSGFALAYLII